MNVGEASQSSEPNTAVQPKMSPELFNSIVAHPEFEAVFKKWLVIGFNYFSENVMKDEPEENRIAMYAIVLISLCYVFMAVLTLTYCTTGRTYFLFPYGSRMNGKAVTMIMRLVLFSSFVFNLQILHGTVFAQKSVSKYIPAFILEAISYFVLQAVVIIIKGYVIIKKEKKKLTMGYFISSLAVVLPELIMVYCCTMAAVKVSNIGIVGSLFAAEIILRGMITLIIWGVHTRLVRSIEKKLKRVKIPANTSDSEPSIEMSDIVRPKETQRRDGQPITTIEDDPPFTTINLNQKEHELYLKFLKLQNPGSGKSKQKDKSLKIV